MLKPIADDIWGIDDRMRMPGGVQLPLRMAIVRLPDRSLLLHSPVRLDEARADAVAALGPVRHLVAPNDFHHLHVKPWAERFPDAKLWGARGLTTKRPDLTFAGAPAPPPGAWGGVLDAVAIEGAPKANEVVFFHRPSATLLCTDLLFNIREPANLGSRLVLSLMGTNGRFALSRLWMVLARDKKAFGGSLRQVLAWPVARVVPAHGEVLQERAAEALRDALARRAAVA